MRFSHCRTPHQSLREYGRGIAGGLMFSLPLLYTMEVWWAGFILHPTRIACYIAATYGLLMIYNRFAGLRQDASVAEVAIDSVEELGLGLVLAAAVLWLTGRIHHGMDMAEVAGKVVIQSMTVAIGVSVGTAQLGAGGEDGEGWKSDEGKPPVGSLPQLALAFCGAILFAANIAPTDEVRMIALGSGTEKLLLLGAVSFFLGLLILHYSGFRGTRSLSGDRSFFERFKGATVTYAVALLAAALSLWFFGQMEGQTLETQISQTVVLGFPAALGASAGRLLVQPNTE